MPARSLFRQPKWIALLGIGLCFAALFFRVRGHYLVRIAVPRFQSSALVLLAQERGYSQQEGIEAEFEFFPTGKLCLDQVIAGKADFAVVYETPVMHAALAGHQQAIFTELHRSEAGTSIVVRRDRGRIEQVAINLVSNAVKYGARNAILVELPLTHA